MFYLKNSNILAVLIKHQILLKNMLESRWFYIWNCKLSDVSSLSVQLPGLHLGLTERSSLQHLQVLNCIGHFCAMVFDHFVTPTNVQWLSTCYFNHCNIFFINKCSPSLMDKTLKKIYKKTTYKYVTIIFLICFKLIASLYK